jgi:hypothetical protein
MLLRTPKGDAIGQVLIDPVTGMAYAAGGGSSSSGLNVVLASDGALVPVDSLAQTKGGDRFGTPSGAATVTVTFNGVNYVQTTIYDSVGDWLATSDWVAQV